VLRQRIFLYALAAKLPIGGLGEHGSGGGPGEKGNCEESLVDHGNPPLISCK